MRSTWLAVGLFASATGCNPFAIWGNATAQRDIAQKATEHFHALLDSAKYGDIYSEADPAFREAVTEKDTDALWRMVQRRFGPVQGTTLATWNVNISTGGGTQVSLVYRTAFAKDSATETFVWRIRDGKPALLRYNINSPSLMRAMIDETDEKH